MQTHKTKKKKVFLKPGPKGFNAIKRWSQMDMVANTYNPISWEVEVREF